MHSKIIRTQLIISIIVGGVLLLRINTLWTSKTAEEWMTLEIIWTVFPGFFLVWLGIPRLTILYNQERLFNQPEIVIKVIGHQWYWEYNLPEIDVNFDSITVKEADIFPLADSRERLILPVHKTLLFLTSSNDVVHSFALPSLGVKADANPGRLNSINRTCNAPGWYIGQCRELCGRLHSNMTISFEFVEFKLFLVWSKLISERN